MNQIMKKILKKSLIKLLFLDSVFLYIKELKNQKTEQNNVIKQ